MIYRVLTKEEWQNAQQQDFYTTDSLATEGFIHCSGKEQVSGVLERFFPNQRELLLIHIDENKLTAPVKYELALTVNEEFPHIYGILNLDAVVEVVEL